MSLSEQKVLIPLGALLLTALWVVLAWSLVRLTRLRSPLGRLIVFLAPLLAAYASLQRLLPDARLQILLVCVGVATLLGIHDLISYRRFRRHVIEDGRPYLEAEAVSAPLLRKLGMPGLAVYQSNALQCGPITLGLRRPVVVFPSWLARELSQDEIYVLMAHELAHIRRHDLVWKWLLLYARRMAFWNPLAAWPYKWISAEIELACDRIVCRLTGKPGTLARTLCKVANLQADKAQWTARPRHIPGADTALHARIASLSMDQSQDFDWVNLLKTTAILVLFFMLCFHPAEMLLAFLR